MFKQGRATAEEKLFKIKGWDRKGLSYWQARLAECSKKAREADDIKVGLHAQDQMQIAEAAVMRLGGLR